MSRDWLDSLKAGDPVLVVEDRRDIPVHVVRRDKVKIVIAYGTGEFRFSAKSGRDFNNTSVWRGKHLKEATPDALAAANLANRRDKAIAKIHRARVDTLPLESLEAAAELLAPSPSPGAVEGARP